jgi:hypothetical protein
MNPVMTASNYYVAINELSAHTTVSTQQNSVQPVAQSSLLHTLSPYLPYLPFVLFAVLFMGAFYIQVVNRVKNLKNVTTSLAIALMLASIPSVLTYISQGGGQTAHAGPDEIPRELRVAKASPTSVFITWKTDAKHIGVVKLGPSPFSDQTSFVYLADNHTEEVQMHSIRVDRLKPGTPYEFKILSGSTWYDNAGKYVQFTQR